MELPHMTGPCSVCLHLLPEAACELLGLLHAGITPNLQDCSFSWHLLAVLQALGAVPVVDRDGKPPLKVILLTEL